MKKKTKKLLTFGALGFGVWWLIGKSQEKKAVEAAKEQVQQSGIGNYITIGQ